MALPTFGTMAVDWEERVRPDRLREERLERIGRLLEESEMGALLCFDMANIRYVTATHIGTWAQDKLTRFCLLPRADKPIMWDFGSAARHHDLYCPWLADGRSRAGISTMRGAMSPESGRAEDVAGKIWTELEARDLVAEPVGVDAVEPPVLFALQERGLQIVDGQQLMQNARVLKTVDEITLLNTACSMVDAAYEELFRELRPGIRENECVGIVSKLLYDMGSEQVEGVNAISGERCSPHPHVYTDRALRPGDPAYFDILHSFMGYRTCYYRTFAVGSGSKSLADAYKRCRYYLDAAIDRVRPGASTGEIAELWPPAQLFGFPDEEAAFALQFGHGVGLSIWEKPVISRLVSLEHPEEIKEGMVFALETFWPASDGWSAARIEEQLVVTSDGCEVITRFPAEELLVAGRAYGTVIGELPPLREVQSQMNTDDVAPAPEVDLPAADEGAPALAARNGPRPGTTAVEVIPQQQVDQQPEDSGLHAELAAWVFELSDVTEEASFVSVPGARALVLSEEAATGPLESFLIGREFAHLHPAPDHSLHLNLPEERAAEVVEAGWAELHPWALEGQIPPTRLLVYAPLDRQGLETVYQLVVESHRFATGRTA